MKQRRGSRALDRLGGVSVGGVALKSPFMTASGTAGHDIELASYMPLHRLGATVAKSLFHEPWPGNPAPRVHTARSGMLNAVGLQGPGVEEWIKESLPRCESAGVAVIASIWGRTIEEYVRAAQQLATVGDRVVAVEVNLSCPNLEGRSGIIAHDSDLSGRIVDGVARASTVPVWAKLSANTDRIVDVARSVCGSGASALTLINTMLGMHIDVATGRPSLGNGEAAFRGLRSIRLRCVRCTMSASRCPMSTSSVSAASRTGSMLSRS